MITEHAVIQALKTVYDPEIPVNIFDLGLIYDIRIQGSEVHLTMTLTTATCPAAAFLPELVQAAVQAVDGVSEASIAVVYAPRWSRDKMSPEARLILGYA